MSSCKRHARKFEYGPLIKQENQSDHESAWKVIGHPLYSQPHMCIVVIHVPENRAQPLIGMKTEIKFDNFFCTIILI